MITSQIVVRMFKQQAQLFRGINFQLNIISVFVAIKISSKRYTHVIGVPMTQRITSIFGGLNAGPAKRKSKRIHF